MAEAGRAVDVHENTLRKWVQQLETERGGNTPKSKALTPDQAGPWVIPAVLTARRLVKTNKIDVVVATGSPWSSLVVAYLINKLTGVPYICDFRDPWIANPFHHTKGKLLDKLSASLERKIVVNSFATSLNTQPLMEQFQARYPNVPKDRFVVIPNGFDVEEFAKIPDKSEITSNKGIITLTHAGFLYGLRDPATLLDAIRQTNELIKEKNLQFCFRQIGAVSLNYDIAEEYADLLHNKSLQLVEPMPYTECLQELKQADYVVNIQPKTTTQVPSKLYDYLALARPIINITPKKRRIRRARSAIRIWVLCRFWRSGRAGSFPLERF